MAGVSYAPRSVSSLKFTEFLLKFRCAQRIIEFLTVISSYTISFYKTAVFLEIDTLRIINSGSPTQT